MSSLPIWLLFALPLTLSYEIHGNKYCVEGYALCSTAFCNPIPDNSTHVTCQCLGPFSGLNVGNTSCQSRAQRLTSTFSLQNQFTDSIPPQPPLYRVHCTGRYAGQWASCFDAPCSTAQGTVTCTCPLRPKSDNLYLSQECPTTREEYEAACSRLRSSAMAAAYADEAILQSFYGNPPSYTECPEV